MIYLAAMKDVNKNSTSIKNWALDDRPREKLLHKGQKNLSNSELLAILIHNGSKEKSALDLAKEILRQANNNLAALHKMDFSDFKQIKGIGPAKAVTIMAALELGKRRHIESMFSKIRIERSKDIAEFLKTILQNEINEHFIVLYLNRANRVTGYDTLSEGGINGTVVDPRLVFKKAVENAAVQIILCHNHPSGNLNPSSADKHLTEKLKEGGKFLDITVMDHIIVSETGFYSFADDGLL
jgi:DNA repair protein RadC